MKSKTISKALLTAILAGSYTPYDLREFVRLCSNLALPLVRKKIITGKLKLTILRMSEPDVLYDCLADLFERDERGGFVQLKDFFKREEISIEHSSEEFLLDTLRRIVFHRVNTSIVRLHSDADPILGKVLHNLEVALERVRLFSKVIRFGESCLIPTHGDALLHNPPLPIEYVRERFARIVALHDSMPAMLKKLHSILMEQNEYQRVISFVSAGLLFKEVYLLTHRTEEVRNAGEQSVETADIRNTVEKVCLDLHKKFHPQYVKKNKTTDELFNTYIAAVRRMLSDGLVEGIESGSLFEALQYDLSELTKQEYAKRHRSIVEYLFKSAKKQLRKELSA